MMRRAGPHRWLLVAGFHSLTCGVQPIDGEVFSRGVSIRGIVFFGVELFRLKLSVSATSKQVDGDATHLYIRWPLPDAGRDGA